MALMLFRLGSFAYRRRWWVLSFWLVILLAVGGAAGAFHGQLSNDFKLPGTETQRVIDHLKAAMPEASGGSASVVFQSKDGKAFTAAQKTSVADVLTRLQGKDQVQNASDPFAVQQQIDAASAKLVDGQKQLDAGKAQLAQAAGLMPPAQAAAAAKDLATKQAALDLAKRQADASSGIRFVSTDGTVAVSQISFSVIMSALSAGDRADVISALKSLQDQGLNVYPSKELSEDFGSLAGPAEIIGLAVAVLVLILMLGTLVAAGLPLLMAIIGVGVGVGATFALSGVIDMNSMTPVLALMLGLAVGIDYSLFIVNRHRTQLLSGMELGESIGRATGTAGNAVLFAGVTVVITLAALAVPGLPFLTLMGLAAAGTVAASVLVSLTLTPAILGFMGRRALSRRAWARAAKHQEHTTHHASDDGATGWGSWITRRPWLAVIGSVLLLAVVAVPALTLRLALPDGGSEPPESDAYQSYALIGSAFGAGMNGPITVVGEMPAGLSSEQATVKQLDVAEQLRQVSHVVAAVPAKLSADGRTAIFQVIGDDGPSSLNTEHLVADLRAKGADISRDQGVTIGLTGQTAANIDVSTKLTEAMPVYLAIVVGLSLVLLLLVFRSIWVPVLATAGFLLSLAASFGAVVAVYQWGWLGAVFGVAHPGPIMSMLPIILIGVLFGLAMDYQVFMGSGMREAFVHGAEAKVAVRIGFRHAATVVTAAAIIMTSVFAGFIFNHLTMVRPIGFSLAFGVLIDAFIVRMTLVPAAMRLLGARAWWLPRWLERILPDVDVEGARLNQLTRG
ncbi:MMPL family transporter [Psychromicrobium xiongbiense]|uniref:MMPL family transporter n=1 Tax=Psychromicrobium xiongbiense TaxID=3051184 RepID=UPI002552959B|nr:MMPL family transporter [Psychromicrobium sp. YIM S02556]